VECYPFSVICARAVEEPERMYARDKDLAGVGGGQGIDGLLDGGVIALAV